jgi:hypothetical protein
LGKDAEKMGGVHNTPPIFSGFLVTVELVDVDGNLISDATPMVTYEYPGGGRQILESDLRCIKNITKMLTFGNYIV